MTPNRSDSQNEALEDHILTIEEVASFCEFKACRVAAGDADQGFVHFNGRGIEQNLYTYGRFTMFGEVKSLPSPRSVLDQASKFRIRSGESTVELSREQFEVELARFLRLVR